ncbi:mitochondrial carrier [Cryphonectria parasitica EP155]|uniref:Mitochondrial carrier n=1 Tax=Cryphonectria parasitica (strain ATCC 38755 / EP155) TaxID=660469 RepID=A0A9P4Y600_CRYP1|nr:mitochondrial carrier [Cryphonectria parasitica EP155]KAF3766725.1 mitochondrial carrier [Cryphonectria parasitica EP155]
MSNSNTDIVLAGAAAAFTIDLLIYPLDTIKTRYQSQDYLKTFAAEPAAARQSRATVFRGLYQGVGSVVVATLPAAGIFFTTYEATKTFYSTLFKQNALLPNGFTVPTPLIHSLASGTAELASCLILTPAEVIKQNAQMIRSRGDSSSSGKGAGGWRGSTSIQALRIVSQSGGASGAAHRLLTGYTALVARNLPFTAIQFPIFEAVRRQIWERRDRWSRRGALTRGLLETAYVNGASAAASGAVAAVITTPTDVVKTRMMLSAGEEKATTAQEQTREAPRRQKVSSLQVARLVYQERGIQGLFRGGLLRAAWTAIGSGLYLGTYEVAKVWLKGTAGEDEEDL